MATTPVRLPPATPSEAITRALCFIERHASRIQPKVVQSRLHKDLLAVIDRHALEGNLVATSEACRDWWNYVLYGRAPAPQPMVEEQPSLFGEEAIPMHRAWDAA